jgi:hypothetical protein
MPGKSQDTLRLLSYASQVYAFNLKATFFYSLFLTNYRIA